VIKLSVIIVNYNVRHFLEQTLRSTMQAISSMEETVEVIVVDNNSPDDSVEMVKAEFPAIQLVARKDNPGFSVANNDGIERSKGQYVLLLNPDTVVAEDTFSKVIAFMDEHSDCGGLGVKMVDGQGIFLPESKRGLPTPFVAFCKMTGLSRLFAKSARFNRYHLGFLPSNETNKIEVLSGAFMAMRKEALDKVGLLDETFFMYGEDIDLSYRLIKGGYKNYYLANTTIIHYKGESTKKGSLNYVKVFYNAMIIFAQKHFAGSQSWLYTSFIRLGIYLRALMSLLFRWFGKVLPVATDVAVMFGGLLWLKNMYANNIKGASNYYDENFLIVNVPIYISLWLISGFFSGGFDRPFRLWSLIRGLILGTILISAVYGFLPENLRYSRALILLGLVWSALILPFVHWLLLVKWGDKNYTEEQLSKIAIVGDTSETQRVQQLLTSTGLSYQFIGQIDPTDLLDKNNPQRLGDLERLEKLVDLYKLQEIIFCAKDVSFKHIISAIEKVGDKAAYKIIHPNANVFIGSNSKDTAGDLYTLEGSFDILQTANRRNKRLLDLSTSLLLLLGMPIAFFIIKRSSVVLQSLFEVLLGKKTWIGVDSAVLEELHLPKGQLPKLRKGVFVPSDVLPNWLSPTIKYK